MRNIYANNGTHFGFERITEFVYEKECSSCSSSWHEFQLIQITSIISRSTNFHGNYWIALYKPFLLHLLFHWTHCSLEIHKCKTLFVFALYLLLISLNCITWESHKEMHMKSDLILFVNNDYSKNSQKINIWDNSDIQGVTVVDKSLLSKKSYNFWFENWKIYDLGLRSFG